MARRAIAVLLAALLAAALCLVCHAAEADSPRGTAGDYTDYIDAGLDIGVQLGDVYDEVARDVFRAQVREYTTAADLLEALRMGRVDALLFDSSYVEPLIASGSYPDLSFLWVPRTVFANESASVFHTAELRDQYNEWLAGLAADGTLDEVIGRWIGVPLPDEADIPTIALTGENGTLRVCSTGNFPPFSYISAAGEPVGFDHEMASRFAQHLGMRVETTLLAYDAILPAVLSGKVDMSACTFTVTDERAQSVLFGAPSTVTQGVLIVPKTGESARDHTIIAGKAVGTLIGSVTDGVAAGPLAATPHYYTSLPDAAEDLRRGRIDGVLLDLSAARILVGTAGNEDLEYVEVPREIFSAPMGAFSNDPAVIDDFNACLAALTADGTIAEMQRRWLEDAAGLDIPMPDIPLDGTAGTLTVATGLTAMPFAYSGADNTPVGYSIELALRFAAHRGMDIRFVDMDLPALIPYVLSGKADLAIANVSITEERSKSVIFSDSIYDDRLAIVLCRAEEAAAGGRGGLFAWIQEGVAKNLIADNRWKMIVDGLGVTMLIAVSAQVLGTAFGCLVCFLLLRKNRFVRWLGELYCGLIHGTPIVVLLMITYYIVFGGTGLSNVFVAVAAFTCITGAGIAGTLKGAIATVDPVEIEAARSLGFSAVRAFAHVTLPQAVRRALPQYTNGFVELVKATAIVGYIAIQDLTRAADIIRSRTYDAYFPLLFIAVLYLLVTTVCVQVFRRIVKRINGGDTQ